MKGDNRLHKKNVLITGATSGIGRATTIQFAEQGANLIITGRRKSRLEELSNRLTDQHGIDIQTANFDVRDRNACVRFIQGLSTEVDILVNNAGLASGVDPVDQASFEDWDAMIDTNIKGLLTMTRLVSERMKKRNSGHIINVGSIAGHEAYPGGVVYAATKHAVHAITKTTKMDLHNTNIRVSSVSPGLVETEFSNVRYHGDDQKADEVYTGITPLTGDDIAEIILFIANRPPHVNIMDTIVFPVSQSSATMVHRSSADE